jgi:protein phosphatase 1 regulatory subunit 7
MSDFEDQPDLTEEQLVAARAAHVHSSEEKQELERINVSEEYIVINGMRIFSLDELPLDDMVACEELEVRKNLLHELKPFPARLREQLTVLDLYDNKIRYIAPFFSGPADPLFADARFQAKFPGVTDLRWNRLRKLDLSYNQLKRIEGLDDLAPTLEELYLVENRLRVIEGLGALHNLKLLELGGNQIRDLKADSLKGLSSLEQLWLGKNKIAAPEPGCFAHTPKLMRLSLQANRLTALNEGVFPPGMVQELKELFVSENGITELRGMENLRGLTMLDVSMNPIRSLYVVRPATAGAATSSEEAPSDARTTVLTVANFPHLEEFWLTDGRLDDWREVELLAAFEATLTTVYLERNPLEKDKRYRDKVYQALPFITQIDSWPVVNKGNLEADRAIHRA